MYARRAAPKRRVLVLLVLLSVAILTLYYRGNGRGVVDYSQQLVLTVVTPLQRITFDIVRPFKRTWGYLVVFAREQRENEKLRLANGRLREELSHLKQYGVENRRLKKLVGFKETSGFDLLPAMVIARSPSNWQAAATIDAGRLQGVARGMTVVTGDGVVGQVIKTTSRAAQIQLIDDQKSGVAVEIARTGQMGVVEGRVDRELFLRYVAKDVDVRIGDRLVTSGIGGVYPRGLVVGTVRRLERSQYSLEKLISVRPAVNFNKLAEVLVVKGRTHGD